MYIYSFTYRIIFVLKKKGGGPEVVHSKNTPALKCDRPEMVEKFTDAQTDRHIDT